MRNPRKQVARIELVNRSSRRESGLTSFFRWSGLTSAAIILGILSGLAVLDLACAGEKNQQKVQTSDELVIPSAGTPERKGYDLFMLNCAHCHGSDARGDDGPDLHGVTRSDARIASLIKNGAKGKMPKFGSKLGDTDVRALIAFVRSLKE